ncbi:MAG: hypothetical protein V7629_19525 [Motiliproteus sp.]
MSARDQKEITAPSEMESISVVTLSATSVRLALIEWSQATAVFSRSKSLPPIYSYELVCPSLVAVMTEDHG